MGSGAARCATTFARQTTPTSCMRFSPKKRRSANGQGEGRRMVMTQQLQEGELFCGLLPRETCAGRNGEVQSQVHCEDWCEETRCSRHCTSKHSPQACAQA